VLLPYVECDARSPVAQLSRCQAADVRRYPTWIIKDARFEGVLTLEELARASGFEAPRK
jgi:hypothetical protein